MPAKQPGSLRLTAAMRLRANRDFVRIKADGKRLVSGSLVANWQILPVGSNLQLGIVTGRKLGNAVVRSRARRLLRESFRLHQHELRQPVALILVARSSIVGKPLAVVERDYLAAMQKAKLFKSA